MRSAGHECDRFVAAGFTDCPFKRMEDEEDEEEQPDEKQRAMEFRRAIPLAERRRGADAVRGANVTDFVNAVAPGETREALERMAAFQNEGGLQFLPRAERLKSALTGQTAQGIFAVLAALATIAAMSRGRPSLSTAPSLVVAHSERDVASRLAQESRDRAGGDKRAIRRLFGFGPTAGFDAFSETGFP